MDLATELQSIYDSEINVEISWLWDDGNEVRLGDRMNGYLADASVPSVADVLGWLQEAIAHFYPDSSYARGLDPELRERAARQIFLPPRTGAHVSCPHWRRAEREPEPHGRDYLLRLLAVRCRSGSEAADSAVGVIWSRVGRVKSLGGRRSALTGSAASGWPVVQFPFRNGVARAQSSGLPKITGPNSLAS
jgi:hypothetical protein